MIAREGQPDSSSPEVVRVLREAFGFDGFREGQAEVVDAMLAGRDCLCVMPTGAGKSLAFQLPALLLDGVTLVVSPLIALMRDQVAALRARGLAAAAIHSGVPPDEQQAILDEAEAGTLKLLYVAPERFRNARFGRRLASLRVVRLAVDEAHCISQWGHDFRPDYRRLGAAREELGRPPTLALTATAPPEVQDDVCEQLGLHEPLRLLQGLVRANLRYEVVHAASRGAKDQQLLGRLRRSEPTLVYAATRKTVERLYHLCRGEGLSVLRYHAGLEDEARKAAEREFLGGDAPLMIATNAFGMGVDRPDIRRVVHYDIPRTVEAYVQETGRAGRDGAAAECILLFHPSDLHVQRFFLDASNPPREVIEAVWEVLRREGRRRLELTSEQVAERLPIRTSAAAVGAALAVLDRAAVLRRGRRSENRAHVTVLPASGDLFSAAPLPPGLGRLLERLIARVGVDRRVALDPAAVASERGVTAETVRRGLARLHDLGRIVYEPAFRGRATEIREEALDGDLLEAVDFELLEAKRRHEESKLDAMVAYAHGHGCRVRYLLGYFGVAEAKPCGLCDGCRERAATMKGLDASGARAVLETVLEAVRAFDRRYGFRKLAGHLAGSSAEGVATGPLGRGETRGRLAHLGVKGAERWLRRAQEAGLLRLVPHRLARSDRMVHTLGLSPQGLRVLKGEPVSDLGPGGGREAP